MRAERFRVQQVLHPTAAHVELVCAAERPLPPLQAGQFYQLLCGVAPETYLPRPFSFYRLIDGQRLTFLLHAVGPGTRWLARLAVGDLIEAFGPLGRGFSIPENIRRAAVAGGGVGLPPLWLLTRQLLARGVKVRALLGARSADLLLGQQEFAELGAQVQVATDDGSAGHHGPVGELLSEQTADVWYACGPTPMLHDVQQRARNPEAPPCQLALEAPMACGYGVCLGCVVERAVPDPALGAYGRWVRVCREGPVFAAGEVVL